MLTYTCWGGKELDWRGRKPKHPSHPVLPSSWKAECRLHCSTGQLEIQLFSREEGLRVNFQSQPSLPSALYSQNFPCHLVASPSRLFCPSVECPVIVTSPKAVADFRLLPHAWSVTENYEVLPVTSENLCKSIILLLRKSPQTPHQG